MKHVYVETNFIVDLLRPLPLKGATDLYGRHGGDITIHVPWCAFTEAKRTLDAIIREDLAFVDNAGRFLGKLGAQRGPAMAAIQDQVREFIDAGRTARRDALFEYPDRLRDLLHHVDVLQPSEAAARRTVDLSRTKSLKPFDEMALGSVLADAAARHAAGARELYFANLNTNDFEPTPGNGLADIYRAVGLTYLSTFDVP